MSEINNNTFDSQPDLIVRSNFGNSTYEFHVYSEFLKRVSRVWKLTLDPNSSFAPLEQSESVSITGVRSTVSVINIENISAEALTIAFNILHHHPLRVPKPIPFTDLQYLARLADQYECKEVLELHAEAAIEALSCDRRHDPTAPGHEGWLLIASVFPRHDFCRKVFLKVLIPFITRSRMGTGDDDIWSLHEVDRSNFVDVDATYIPLKVKTFILESRRKLAYILAKPLHDFAQKLLSHETLSRPVAPSFMQSDTRILCSNETCTALILGHFVRNCHVKDCQFALDRNLVIPDATSVSQLAQSIDGIRVQFIFGMGAVHDESTIGKTGVEAKWDAQYEKVGHHGNVHVCALASRFVAMKKQIAADYQRGLKEVESEAMLLIQPQVVQS